MTTVATQREQRNSSDAPDSFHDRAWWRVEAARNGLDWPGVLTTQALVIDAWRARDSRMSGAAHQRSVA